MTGCIYTDAQHESQLQVQCLTHCRKGLSLQSEASEPKPLVGPRWNSHTNDMIPFRRVPLHTEGLRVAIHVYNVNKKNNSFQSHPGEAYTVNDVMYVPGISRVMHSMQYRDCSAVALGQQPSL